MSVHGIKNWKSHSKVISLSAEYSKDCCSGQILGTVNDKLNNSNNKKDDTLGNSDGQEETPINIAEFEICQGNKNQNQQRKLPHKQIESFIV